MKARKAYIALGGNIGNREATLSKALELMQAVEGVAVRRISRFIETSPVTSSAAVDTRGPENQPPYLNAAAEVETTLAPRDLLAALQGVERALGRDRARETRWGPRTCDLDILMIDGVIMDEPDLTIPHPRLCERAFVLIPLAEIAPDAVHPTTGRTVAQLLAALGDARGDA